MKIKKLDTVLLVFTIALLAFAIYFYSLHLHNMEAVKGVLDMPALYSVKAPW